MQIFSLLAVKNLHLNRIVLQYGFLSFPSALISNAFHFTICIYCMEIVFLLKAQCNSVRLLFFALCVFSTTKCKLLYISYLLVQGWYLCYDWDYAWYLTWKELQGQTKFIDWVTDLGDFFFNSLVAFVMPCWKFVKNL